MNTVWDHTYQRLFLQTVQYILYAIYFICVSPSENSANQQVDNGYAAGLYSAIGCIDEGV